jgi:hypothetical protein
MAKSYKVLSDNCTLGKVGETVTPADMSDDNLAALVAGGHLEEVKKETKTETASTKENI